MKSHLVIAFFCLSLMSCLSGEGEPYYWWTEYSKSPSQEEKGASSFLYFDFNALNGEGLENNVIPWKLATAAVLYNRRVPVGQREEALKAFFKEYGFLYADKIENTPQALGGDYKLKDSPVGMVRGEIDLKIDSHLFPRGILPRVEGAVLGCASCHSGVSYDSQGSPLTQNVWLGLPNTSLNLQGYLQEVYGGLKTATQDEHLATFKEYLKDLYPDARETESGFFVSSTLKQVKKRLENAGTESFFPFHNGFPGVTNGVAAFKHQMNTGSRPRNLSGDRGFTSIPALFDREYRSSFLYDGAYSPAQRRHRFRGVGPGFPGLSSDEIASIVSFFTIPTMGNTEESAAAAIPYTAEIIEFMKSAERPRWPGQINRAQAQKGFAHYQKHCAQCHGTYRYAGGESELIHFPNRLSPLGEIKTDPTRAMAISDSFISRTSKGVISRYIRARRTEGYVAPLLTSIALTAPYLHNGSVPTLWQLMQPELRPKAFYVGGHALNMQEVGVQTDHRGYTAFSRPILYDTSAKGQGAQGHTSPFDKLSSLEKWELLEFLKTL